MAEMAHARPATVAAVSAQVPGSCVMCSLVVQRESLGDEWQSAACRQAGSHAHPARPPTHPMLGPLT